MKIITEYPLWLLILCITGGLLYSVLLYYRNKKLNEINNLIKGLLFFFRFVLVTVISFFLLGPFIKTIFREIEKPVIILLSDNSESLKGGSFSDTTFLREYKKNILHIENLLSDKYEIENYSFSDYLQEGTDFELNGKQTDISGAIDELYNKYSNRNIGALILATDGIYNKGMNPLHTASKLNFPIYTIALGDTNIRKDLILKNVYHNKIAYLGNEFPIEIVIDAEMCKGEKSKLTVYKNTNPIITHEVSIENENQLITIPVKITANETGLQKYSLKLSQLENELSYTNNIKDIYIDILDNRQKILILAASPHPDIAAIRNTIEKSDNYEVEVGMARDFKKPLKWYNLIILHQLPSVKTNSTGIINEITKDNMPVLFITGSETDYNSLNTIRPGLTINAMPGKSNDCIPFLNNSFSLFTLSENLRGFVKKFPPLISPFGNFSTSNAAQSLFFQKIGIVETQNPLFVFNSTIENKSALIAGEGLWRWKIADYAEHGNNDIFNELVLKTVQYLSLKTDKSRFRISGKNNFPENEPVIFNAEYYNESYELVNEPEVNMEITNAEGNKFSYVFTRTTDSYRLNAGILPVGDYKYTAGIAMSEKTANQSGVFSVAAIQIESAQLVANHNLLYNISQKNNGAMFYINQTDNLADNILSNNNIKPISYTQKKLSDLINLKWIFVLIILLLSAEWFLRKRNGIY